MEGFAASQAACSERGKASRKNIGDEGVRQAVLQEYRITMAFRLRSVPSGA